MKAGCKKSVSPLICDDYHEVIDVMANEGDSDGDDEGIEGVMNEMGGKPCERVGLEKEEDVIRVLKDPKLPTRDEVEKHNVMGLFILGIGVIYV